MRRYFQYKNSNYVRQMFVLMGIKTGKKSFSYFHSICIKLFTTTCTGQAFVKRESCVLQ